MSEVWDSQQQLEAFGARIMRFWLTLHANIRVNPRSLEVHNIIRRQREPKAPGALGSK